MLVNTSFIGNYGILYNQHSRLCMIFPVIHAISWWMYIFFIVKDLFFLILLRSLLSLIFFLENKFPYLYNLMNKAFK